MNNKEQERYQQQIIRKQRLELMLKNMRVEKEGLEKSREYFVDYLESMDEKIKEIENISLASLYYKMFTNKYNKVGRETLEKYAISIKFNLVCKEIIELDKEIDRANNELSCLVGCEKRYIGAFMKNLDYLKEIKLDVGAGIMELENKITYLNGQRKEMNKAIEAGQVLLRTISSVKNGLESAKSWGNKNVLEGDIHFVNKKFQYIENTQKSLCRMQLLLRKFYIELNEVSISIADQVIIYEFSNFVYRFYEGLFSDRGFFRHIATCQCELKQMDMEVTHVVDKLKRKCKIIEYEKNILHRKQNELENKIETV